MKKFISALFFAHEQCLPSFISGNDCPPSIKVERLYFKVKIMSSVLKKKKDRKQARLTCASISCLTVPYLYSRTPILAKLMIAEDCMAPLTVKQLVLFITIDVGDCTLIDSLLNTMSERQCGNNSTILNRCLAGPPYDAYPGSGGNNMSPLQTNGHG